jgi:hypothetical protein
MTEKENLLALLAEILPYAKHTSTCGVRLAGSDCGSYHAPYCRLDAIKQRINEVSNGNH